MDVTQMETVQLKAIAYDIIERMQALQVDLQTIQIELQSRQESQEVTEDGS
jgi:hypothetical protein